MLKSETILNSGGRDFLNAEDGYTLCLQEGARRMPHRSSSGAAR